MKSTVSRMIMSLHVFSFSAMHLPATAAPTAALCCAAVQHIGAAAESAAVSLLLNGAKAKHSRLERHVKGFVTLSMRSVKR